MTRAARQLGKERLLSAMRDESWVQTQIERVCREIDHSEHCDSLALTFKGSKSFRASRAVRQISQSGNTFAWAIQRASLDEAALFFESLAAFDGTCIFS